MTAFILYVLGALGFILVSFTEFEDYKGATKNELLTAAAAILCWPLIVLVGCVAICLDYWDYWKSKKAQEKKKEDG